jgi:AraC-like DNA-binding protein
MIELADKVRNWETLAQRAGYSSGNLAILCGVSARHLRRIFRGMFGRTAQAMLDEKQLKDAETALRGGLLVKELASELEYKHPGNFSHWFKLRRKITPSQFLARKVPSSDAPFVPPWATCPRAPVKSFASSVGLSPVLHRPRL